jgi:hypothetical protein
MTTRPKTLVPCPACSGRGGESDPFDEYDPCDLCDDTGTVTADAAERWRDEEAATARALDAWTRGKSH